MRVEDRPVTIALSQAERTDLLGQMLRRALPWLLQKQLPTGEFLCLRQHADKVLPCACPLLSALALDALDCLDPNSDHFHERLFDLIPPRDRARVRVTVSTLRWRLLMHLAINQEADGSWRRFGRNGASPRCVATTGFALLMYLRETLRPQRDFAGIIERARAEGEGDAAGEVFAARLASLAGRRVARLPAAFVASLTHEADPVLALWAIAQGCHEGALHLEPDGSAALLELALRQLNAEGSFGTHGKKALGITVLSVCDDGSPGVRRAIDGAITELLLQPQSPSQWPHQPLAFTVDSAPVVLLLALRSLAQAILAPQARGEDRC